MKITYLKRSLLFRYAVLKVNAYSEIETNILIAVFVMNAQYKRCSCNTLFMFLSKLKHTPYRKKLLAIVRKFKALDMVRVQGSGPGTQMYLTTQGKLYLADIEKKLKEVSIKS